MRRLLLGMDSTSLRRNWERSEAQCSWLMAQRWTLSYNVKFVPKLAPYNLFSITQAIANGWNIGNKGQMIYLKKDMNILQFYVVIKTKTGWVSGVQIMPRIDENIAIAALGPGKSVGMMEYHDMLCHVSEATTKATSRYYDIKLKGKFEICAD
jgi:hypothetical protein